MRLILWAVAFAVGDASAVGGTAGWRMGVAALALGATIVGLSRGHRWSAAGPFAFLALGVLLGGRALRPPALGPTLSAAIASDDPRSIEAVVEHGPEDTGAGARLIVALRKIAGAPAAGTLALAVANGWPDFGPGETIECQARLRALRGTRNPGLPDPVLALRAIGIDALAGVPTAGGIRRIAEPSGIGPRRAAYLARRALRAAIDRGVGGEAGAFLKTAVLGDRRGVAPEVEEGFRAAGATHVLSVSGLHLAAVAALFFLIVRGTAARIPGLPLFVDPRAIAAAASLPAIAFFALLTGEAVATERSALMLAIGMGALLVGRPASAGPTIAAAALILLIARPLQIFDVSLQLSVASVTGIALLSHRLGPRAAPVDGLLRRVVRWLWRFGAATAAATAATAPLVAHCFGEVAPLAPVGNLALVPLVELAVVPAGLAGATAAAIWAPLGRLPLAVATAAARLALEIAATFRAHAPILVCRSPNSLETFALTAAGGLALGAFGARAGRRRVLGFAALVCALIAASSLTIRDFRRRTSHALIVTFLDVGQGDAAVVEAPGRHADRWGRDTGRPVRHRCPYRRALPASPGDRPPRDRRALPPPSRSSGRVVSNPRPIRGRRVLVERRRRAQPRVPPADRSRATARCSYAGGRADRARRRAGRPSGTVPRRPHRRAGRTFGQRRLAGSAHRLRWPRAAVSRRSRSGWGRRAGGAAGARSGGRVRYPEGPPPRQPDIIQR